MKFTVLLLIALMLLTPAIVSADDSEWGARYIAAFNTMNFEEQWFFMSHIRQSYWGLKQANAQFPANTWAAVTASGDMFFERPFSGSLDAILDAAVFLHEAEHVRQYRLGSWEALIKECEPSRTMVRFMERKVFDEPQLYPRLAYFQLQVRIECGK